MKLKNLFDALIKAAKLAALSAALTSAVAAASCASSKTKQKETLQASDIQNSTVYRTAEVTLDANVDAPQITLYGLTLSHPKAEDVKPSEPPRTRSPTLHADSVRISAASAQMKSKTYAKVSAKADKATTQKTSSSGQTQRQRPNFMVIALAAAVILIIISRKRLR